MTSAATPDGHPETPAQALGGLRIDVALVDAHVAMLINEGVGYLTDGKVPRGRGNDQLTNVPYGTFPASDGSFILAIGNDGQFARFVAAAGSRGLSCDPRFATSAAPQCTTGRC